ncbi:MAG: hypothetical protein SGPRY_013416, partial [Prymnesium sp.]
MATQYQPPEWSASPSSRYTLEVLKDGSLQQTHELSSRPFYILGRHASTAHLLIEHASVSRAHAVVQHRASGEVYLIDLGSTHGTFLNKKRLEPHMYTPLRLGSVIKLGGSSRSLVLMGEKEPFFDPSAAGAVPAGAGRENAADRAQKIAKRTGKSLGAGWGFGADAYEVKEADDPLEELSFEALYSQAKEKGLNMTSKQSRLVEQLEKRVEKLDNLASENDRISAKELEGLSEGQRRQLERNESRIKELQEQVASLKETISESLREQLGAPHLTAPIQDGKRTAPPRAAPAVADSEESLRAKLATLQ